MRYRPSACAHPHQRYRAAAGAGVGCWAWTLRGMASSRTIICCASKTASNAGRAFVFMQLGIPVVADMTPECCQIVQQGRTGFVAQSAAGWHDALERLIVSATLRQHLAENAADLFATLYNRQAYVAQLLAGMTDLLAASAAAHSSTCHPCRAPCCRRPICPADTRQRNGCTACSRRLAVWCGGYVA
ncbi:MAG: glycosyltransferase [Chloroflexaceae bacterium]|nr:glycosyltransferase [Chloroflexaceae bacterium]